MINNNIIFNSIDNGIIILDEKLEISAWNYWLEIRTNIKENEIKGKNICEVFSYINKKKLSRKIKSVLFTNNPSYYNVDPHKFLIKIELNSILEKIYDYMQQDITIVPYNTEKKQVCMFIYDKTPLCETNFKLEKLNEQLIDSSNKDYMTQSYNRKYFTEISEKMLYLSKRNKEDLSLIILDIDLFKSINDSYGHYIGDKVIILLAKTLEESIRFSDISARFGGEEFVALFNNSNLENTYILSEEIREKVEKLELNVNGEKLKFTISIGVAQFNEKIDIKGIENTLNRADDALYIAKKNGRNQVVKNY